MAETQQTVYEMIGGEPTFRRLVDAFYARIEADEALRAIFPTDLGPGKKHQYLFLMQYWGGPNLYAQERGHPRMRLRHAPYAITPDLSARWVMHMHAAIDEVGIQEPARSMMREYFEQGAAFLVNRYVEMDDD